MRAIMVGVVDELGKNPAQVALANGNPVCAGCLSDTATPATNRGKCRHSMALSGFEPGFLRWAQRSVNRKVQGSNPCSGAKTELESAGFGRRSCRAM